MIAREKQKSDQEKKHVAHQKSTEHPQHDGQVQSQQSEQAQSGQPNVGMATDPEATKDKGYVKRIEEKTQKH